MKFRTLLIALVFLSFFSSSSVYANDPYLVSFKDLRKHKETHGVLFKQPRGPFAVMIFNEFALGITAGVIYYEQMANPADEKWWISKRFWQESPWRDCITSIAWDKTGKYLYIGTSEVYGDGGVFKLDLYKQTFTRLHPKTEEGLKEISSTEIIELNQTNGKLKVKVTLADYKTTKIVEIPTE